jgi:hypothetical protein
MLRRVSLEPSPEVTVVFPLAVCAEVTTAVTEDAPVSRMRSPGACEKPPSVSTAFEAVLPLSLKNSAPARTADAPVCYGRLLEGRKRPVRVPRGIFDGSCSTSCRSGLTH